MFDAKFVIRKQEGFYLAHMSGEMCSDENSKPQHFYHGFEFKKYVDDFGAKVDVALQLAAVAGLQPRNVSAPSARDNEITIADLVRERKEIAKVMSGIYYDALNVASQNEFPYFGVVVVTSSPIAKIDVLPEQPQYVSAKEKGILSRAIYREVERFNSEGKNPYYKVPRVEWVLHPTVQLYAPLQASSSDASVQDLNKQVASLSEMLKQLEKELKGQEPKPKGE